MPDAGPATGGLFGLDGKVVLITGAGHGQGAAEARLFLQAGAGGVLLADIDARAGAALARELGGRARFYPLDVADQQSWEAAVAFARSSWGRLDCLVNNAGVYLRQPIGETSLPDYERVCAVNQRGVFLGLRAAAPLIADGGGGAIVNISSTAGIVGSPGMIAYAASKWAVRGMTKVAAAEFGPLGIRVNSVHPGLIETDMIQGDLSAEARAVFLSRLPSRRVGTPRDVAGVVLFAASDLAAYCTGGEFTCDGGFTAL